MTLVTAVNVLSVDIGNMVAYWELVFSTHVMGLSVFGKNPNKSSCIYEET